MTNDTLGGIRNVKLYGTMGGLECVFALAHFFFFFLLSLSSSWNNTKREELSTNNNLNRRRVFTHLSSITMRVCSSWSVCPMMDERINSCFFFVFPSSSRGTRGTRIALFVFLQVLRVSAIDGCDRFREISKWRRIKDRFLNERKWNYEKQNRDMLLISISRFSRCLSAYKNMPPPPLHPALPSKGLYVTRFEWGATESAHFQDTARCLMDLYVEGGWERNKKERKKNLVLPLFIYFLVGRSPILLRFLVSAVWCD